MAGPRSGGESGCWGRKRRSKSELTLNFFCQFLILLKKFVSPMYADYGIMVNGSNQLM